MRTQAIEWAEAFAQATILATQHGQASLGRSLDILHVATCRILEIKTLWTLDRRQHTLAARTGLELNQLPTQDL